MHLNVGHDAAEFGERTALQFGAARVLLRKVRFDGEGLADLAERLFIGLGEGIDAGFGGVSTVRETIQLLNLVIA